MPHISKKSMSTLEMNKITWKYSAILGTSLGGEMLFKHSLKYEVESHPE